MSVSLVMTMKQCMSLIMVLVLVCISVPSMASPAARQGQARRWDQLKIELMKTFVDQARDGIVYSTF